MLVHPVGSLVHRPDASAPREPEVQPAPQARRGFKVSLGQKAHKAFRDLSEIQDPPGCRGLKGLPGPLDQSDPLAYAAYKALQVPLGLPVTPDRLGLLDRPAAWGPPDHRGQKELQAPLGQ